MTSAIMPGKPKDMIEPIKLNVRLEGPATLRKDVRSFDSFSPPAPDEGHTALAFVNIGICHAKFYPYLPLPVTVVNNAGSKLGAGLIVTID